MLKTVFNDTDENQEFTYNTNPEHFEEGHDCNAACSPGRDKTVVIEPGASWMFQVDAPNGSLIDSLVTDSPAMKEKMEDK